MEHEGEFETGVDEVRGVADRVPGDEHRVADAGVEADEGQANGAELFWIEAIIPVRDFADSDVS